MESNGGLSHALNPTRLQPPSLSVVSCARHWTYAVRANTPTPQDRHTSPPRVTEILTRKLRSCIFDALILALSQQLFGESSPYWGVLGIFDLQGSDKLQEILFPGDKEQFDAASQKRDPICCLPLSDKVALILTCASSPRTVSILLVEIIAAINPKFDPAHSTRQLSVKAGLSALSAVPENLKSQECKMKRARDRISRCVPHLGSKTDQRFIPCLNPFLDWILAEGVDSLSHDVERCGGDDQCLYNILRIWHLDSRNQSLLPPVYLSHPNRKKIHFHEKCLHRDGYRCVITQQMDIGHC
ncbi:conserved hypothetical protein [Histoplasma capsulatum H143]|uniref:Uncharacterized protein n=1 Tax=Ajellomyces capsulatus (strain H143) TaxID=544712 RepID=C6HJV7_AJECH|nr:conserved hypothetical protein [Histoplasma capsulatum H143]